MLGNVPVQLTFGDILTKDLNFTRKKLYFIPKESQTHENLVRALNNCMSCSWLGWNNHYLL